MVGSKDLEPSTAPFFPKVFFHNQFRAKAQHLSQSTNLNGKVAIITGGNTGLGLEASKQLLSFKLSHLILAVRSSSKGKAAASELSALYPKAKIEVWSLDMSSYDSIQEFAKQVNTQLSRLDIVILNAGVRKLQFGTVGSTGHEEAIQINYLSTVLLATLLLPSLKSKSPSGSPGRLTISGAALALAAKFPNKNKVPLLASFDDPATFDPIDRYNTSKLLMHMFLWKLVDYVSADDVIVNVADPGFVKGTDLTRDAKGGAKIGAAVFGAIAGRTIPDGASTYLDAAVKKGRESHGCFIMSWEIHPFAPSLYDAEGKAVTERLWDETMAELQFANPLKVLEGLREG
ncbi:hypothetical protein B0I35DRAFT_436152 [Stachybotrys elegans]|uniref:Short-chain dehydrogenase/reductase family protein n=1 Tax=Stachybotrys elegans TaxID=80388 RepID=A0A8K0SU15_9HYPO|nr:hypothetical protein B0I35DRAFT_436152 [Stachybotrys elegans]